MTDVEAAAARTLLATEQNDITKRLFAAVSYREQEFVERLLRCDDSSPTFICIHQTIRTIEMGRRRNNNAA